ncbi:MAG: hypothetical protein R3B93_14005 [Bacteroidia bacterium]
MFCFADQEIYCDGATQWIFLPEEGEFGEVTITHYDLQNWGKMRSHF